MRAYLGVDVGSVGVKAALLVPRDEWSECMPAEGAGVAPLQDTPARGAGVAPGTDGFRALTGGRRGEWAAVVAPGRRTRGRPQEATWALLYELLDKLQIDLISGITVTGSGGALVAAALGAGRCNEFQAIARAVDLLHPDVRTVFEIGGERSKYLQLTPDPADGVLRIRDYGTNGDCAAGTGGFLDQQAGRLHYQVQDIAGIVRDCARCAQIAGRCSVFAKSDMIHAQQKGFAPPEVLRGLCKAVAGNFRMAVVKGRTPEPPVAFLGGVSANDAVARELAEAFELDGDKLFVPPAADSFGAIGAALAATEADGDGIDLRERLARLKSAAGDGAGQFNALVPLTLNGTTLLRDRVKSYSFPSEAVVVDAYLGLDIGSVGTKLVVIDTDGQVIHSIFTRTDGRPVEVVTRCLGELEQAVGSRVRIRGVGSTGSGRELIGELVGADSINDEITCHKTGATFIGDRMLGKRPDTIFEIGGQDSKYIRLQQAGEDTVVVDFTMNEACAAGTGSFLEERAEELGVAIKGQFSELALVSGAPLRLGERCTVFMERDVNACMQRGARREDVIAGLAYSVVYNYINRVVRGRSIGECIFFQGGTACNDAVVAAFRAVTGKEIIVPPHNAVLGAIGAAMLAREKVTSGGNGQQSRFRGWDMTAVDYKLREFTCKACSNTCSIQEFNVQGEKTYWGDKCSERYRKRAKTDRKPVIADLVALRQQLLMADDTGQPADPAARTVAIPLAMYTLDLLPLWRRFFQDCGFKVLVSSPTNRGIVERGSDCTVAEPCFPIIVAHGHVAELLEQKPDYLWLPNLLSSETKFTDNESHVCPWGQTLPFVIRQAPLVRAWGGQVLCPTLRMRHGPQQLRAPMLQLARELGVPRRQAARAFEAGAAALEEFRSAYRQAGCEALAVLERTGASGIVLVGRPYNMHDAGVSLAVARKLRDLYGVNVLPMDALPLEDIDIRDINENMFWAYGRKILAAAKLVGQHPNLHIIYVTNFKCGPDSFIKGYIRRASGKPFLSLQFDGHSNDAGMMTRCEAYLDSKGFLRWWRKSQHEPTGKGSPGGPCTSPKWPTPAPGWPPRPFAPSGSTPPSRPQPAPKR